MTLLRSVPVLALIAFALPVRPAVAAKPGANTVALGTASMRVGSRRAQAVDAAPAKEETTDVTEDAAKAEDAKGPSEPEAASVEAPAPVAAPPVSDEFDEEKVASLHASARAKYETQDFDGAVEDWTEAYREIPATETNREIRNNLIFNLAGAHESAFELSGGSTHLRQAKGLLRRYIDEYKALYRPTPQGREEFVALTARLEAIEKLLAEAEKEEAAAVETSVEPAPDGEATGETDEDAPTPSIETIIARDPALSKRYKGARGMMIGGGVGLGLGGVVALSAIGGSTRSQVATRLIVGLSFAAVGGTFLGIGIVRKKKVREEAKAQIAFVPTTDKLGFAIVGRF